MNCLLKTVQSISYFSCQGNALCKGKQDEESNFKQLLLQAEDDEVLRKCIEKSYGSRMSPNAQNEVLQIMALNVLHGIASDIANPDMTASWLMRALMRATLNSLKFACVG